MSNVTTWRKLLYTQTSMHHQAKCLLNVLLETELLGCRTKYNKFDQNISSLPLGILPVWLVGPENQYSKVLPLQHLSIQQDSPASRNEEFRLPRCFQNRLLALPSCTWCLNFEMIRKKMWEPEKPNGWLGALFNHLLLNKSFEVKAWKQSLGRPKAACASCVWTLVGFLLSTNDVQSRMPSRESPAFVVCFLYIYIHWYKYIQGVYNVNKCKVCICSYHRCLKCHLAACDEHPGRSSTEYLLHHGGTLLAKARRPRTIGFRSEAVQVGPSITYP